MRNLPVWFSVLILGAVVVPGPAQASRPITTRVSVSTTGSQADSYSLEPAISADGRYITYRSYASNLVPDDTNNVFDIFVRDRGGLSDTS